MLSDVTTLDDESTVQAVPTTSTVLVTGSTGTTGSRISSLLRAHLPAVRLRETSRSGEADRVPFDWYRPEGHDAVLDGVDRMYLVPPVGEVDPAAVMIPFLRRASRRGMRRVVLLGAAAVDAGDPGVGVVQTALPDLTEEWAVLRPSWFMQNFIGHHQARSLREHGAVVSAAEDGKVPFIDADDIAAVAGQLLLGPDPVRRELVLTGPEALDHDQIAAEISRVSGRDVRHRRLTPSQLAREVHVELPDGFAAVLAELDARIAAGAFATLTDEVRQVTGREPTAFGDFARRHHQAWTSP